MSFLIGERWSEEKLFEDVRFYQRTAGQKGSPDYKKRLLALACCQKWERFWCAVGSKSGINGQQ